MVQDCTVGDNLPCYAHALRYACMHFLPLGFFGVLGSPITILSVVLYIAPVGCMADSCGSGGGAGNSSMLCLQFCLLLRLFSIRVLSYSMLFPFYSMELPLMLILCCF